MTIALYNPSRKFQPGTVDIRVSFLQIDVKGNCSISRTNPVSIRLTIRVFDSRVPQRRLKYLEMSFVDQQEHKAYFPSNYRLFIAGFVITSVFIA